PHWHKDPSSPYPQIISHLLTNLKAWVNLEHLSLLLANGDDPMIGLQVGLDREDFSFDDLTSDPRCPWQSQTIYSYHRNTLTGG
ncbi:MAG: cyclohydrolase, partial [Cyanobacteriota bacterium]